MADTFTIKGLLNKEYLQCDQHRQGGVRYFYVYEQGRWLCMLKRANDSAYTILSYSSQLPESKLSLISKIIDSRFDVEVPV